MTETRPNEEDLKRIKHLCTLRKAVVELSAKIAVLSRSGTKQKKAATLLAQGFLAGKISDTAKDMTNGMEPYQRRELIELLATLLDQKQWLNGALDD